ncbi:MAG: MlaD family protein [Pseudomonadota bacterium]
MKDNLAEALIGTLVLIVAGFFVSYAYSRTDTVRGDGTEYVARFGRIDGLAIGSDVRIAGIKVGTVTKTGLDLEGGIKPAVINFTVKSDIVLPIDTEAIISSEGLLGGSYLTVEPGGDFENLAAGDMLEYTQDSIDIVSLFGQAVFAATGSSSDDSSSDESQAKPAETGP